MRADSALGRLKEGELCIVTTKTGEYVARWSVTGWCFVRLERGMPVIIDHNAVEEWRPA